jgi:ParB family transcriptional regulator, chromosome partitioning protein
MQIPEKIAIADIDDSQRLRPVKESEVELIAVSIDERGLTQPIVVRPVNNLIGQYILVVGAHRLAAMRLLGWTELTVGEQVIVREMDETTARIMEIDENVARHELNPLDRALFLAERKRLYDLARGETRGRKRKDVEFKENEKVANMAIFSSPRFTKEVSERTNLSERTVRRAVELAERLSPEAIAAIRGTGVETNQQELLALAEAEPEAQLALARKISSGEAKTVLQAKWACGFEAQPANDPQARLLANLADAWDRASKPTRASFMKKAGLVYSETRK